MIGDLFIFENFEDIKAECVMNYSQVNAKYITELLNI